MGYFNTVGLWTSDSYLSHEGRSKEDGAKQGSGRYPLGSGERPYQHTGGGGSVGTGTSNDNNEPTRKEKKLMKYQSKQNKRIDKRYDKKLLKSERRSEKLKKKYERVDKAKKEKIKDKYLKERIEYHKNEISKAYEKMAVGKLTYKDAKHEKNLYRSTAAREYVVDRAVMNSAKQYDKKRGNNHNQMGIAAGLISMAIDAKKYGTLSYRGMGNKVVSDRRLAGKEDEINKKALKLAKADTAKLSKGRRR